MKHYDDSQYDTDKIPDIRDQIKLWEETGTPVLYVDDRMILVSSHLSDIEFIERRLRDKDR